MSELPGSRHCVPVATGGGAGSRSTSGGTGVCRCPDECLVTPEGWCEHGIASWALVLAALAEDDAATATFGAAPHAEVPSRATWRSV